ncbi:TPA: hypothetical protein ACXIO5_001932 [Neisseria meningitidis]
MPSENRSAGVCGALYAVLQDKAQGRAVGCIVATVFLPDGVKNTVATPTDNEKREQCRLNRVLRRV